MAAPPLDSPCDGPVTYPGDNKAILEKSSNQRHKEGKSHVTPMFIGKGKGKAIPLQAWTGPEGSRRLRLPDF